MVPPPVLSAPAVHAVPLQYCNALGPCLIEQVVAGNFMAFGVRKKFDLMLVLIKIII